MELFSDRELASRLEAAEVAANGEYAEAHARLYPGRGTATLAVGGGLALYAGSDSPLSHATGLGMNGPVSAEELDRLEAFYRERGARVLVQLCPLADASLVRLLGERSYRLQGFLNVFVRPFTPSDVPAPDSGGIQVERVRPEEGELWARTVQQGFLGRDTVDDSELEIPRCNLHLASAAAFLARVEGEPAGAGAVAVRGRLATFFSTSTRPGYRRRGVQTALLRARLAFAAEQGCDLGHVRATPGGISQRNVERAGFRVVYTKALFARE